MVSVLCAILISDEENMFFIHENNWRRHRNYQWVLRKSCFLRSTTGGIRCVYLFVGFVLGSLEGASALRCRRC